MLKLIRLEYRKTNLRPYTLSVIIATILFIGFIYLFAYIPRIDEDPELLMFAEYSTVSGLLILVSLTTYSVLASAMFAKMVIDTFDANSLTLIYSYPVRRSAILLSKIIAVLLFTAAAMMISNTVVFTLFFLTESISPLVNDTFVSSVVLDALSLTLLSMAAMSAISVTAMTIGLYRQSVPLTIISTVVILASTNNVFMEVLSNPVILLVTLVLCIVVLSVSTLLAAKHVRDLEVA
ncbi:hypothetical protein [Salinicoccus albus]|uniref:hypothetical protein n=1 Tax=Salinicoccus albus TaxID=418756 RepID=UPI00039DC64E|nr:hypothetical protein [Salinicoccus albus]